MRNQNFFLIPYWLRITSHYFWDERCLFLGLLTSVRSLFFLSACVSSPRSLSFSRNIFTLRFAPACLYSTLPSLGNVHLIDNREYLEYRVKIYANYDDSEFNVFQVGRMPQDGNGNGNGDGNGASSSSSQSLESIVCEIERRKPITELTAILNYAGTLLENARINAWGADRSDQFLPHLSTPIQLYASSNNEHYMSPSCWFCLLLFSSVLYFYVVVFFLCTASRMTILMLYFDFSFIWKIICSRCCALDHSMCSQGVVCLLIEWVTISFVYCFSCWFFLFSFRFSLAYRR